MDSHDVGTQTTYVTTLIAAAVGLWKYTTQPVGGVPVPPAGVGTLW
jgi:hypothetical protein